MSVEQIEASILALPLTDRKRLVEWLNNHHGELLGGPEVVSDEVRTELELRLRELEEHPEQLEPFEEEDVNRMFQEFADARSQKTSARKS